MINYRLIDVKYQITAGINLMLNYGGRDEFTRLLAFVNVDLKLQPTLLDWFVMCNSSATNCSDSLAGAVFTGVEALFAIHP
jgi:undecaprenyl pyrophosphate synthase